MPRTSFAGPPLRGPELEGEHGKLYKEGRLYFPSNGGTPRHKRYLDEMPGASLQHVWTDIKPIGAQAAERVGFPTQKPQELLERIVAT